MCEFVPQLVVKRLRFIDLARGRPPRLTTPRPLPICAAAQGFEQGRSMRGDQSRKEALGII
jgi:hypothetical protein